MAEFSLVAPIGGMGLQDLVDIVRDEADLALEIKPSQILAHRRRRVVLFLRRRGR